MHPGNANFFFLTSLISSTYYQYLNWTLLFKHFLPFLTSSTCVINSWTFLPSLASSTVTSTWTGLFYFSGHHQRAPWLCTGSGCPSDRGGQQGGPLSHQQHWATPASAWDYPQVARLQEDPCPHQLWGWRHYCGQQLRYQQVRAVILQGHG